MTIHKVLIVPVLAMMLTQLKGQDPVIMTINDRPVKKSEFEAVYRKNNGKEVNGGSKSVREYVDLFSLFKSKVFEAESLGLDTLSSFKTELAGYRKTLAAPYLTDRNTNEDLLNEAYERMKNEVRASHILVRLGENALPKDTLEAWTRVNIIRNALNGKFPTQAEISSYDKLLRASTGIEPFLKKGDSSLYKHKMNTIRHLSEVAKESGDKFPLVASRTSDDPSVLENKGDLNYFSAFDMVYPFESAAFNTPVGQISPLVRTRFGYHVLKVYDKRPSRGEISVSHIMTEIKKNATPEDKARAKAKIDEIYTKLKAGQGSFEELARQFSEDKQTSDKGGLLQPTKGGNLPKPFVDAAFALQKNGDVSEPVETRFGYHIIKRNDLKSIAPFAEMKNELKSRVSRDSRSQRGRAALIQKVKKENGFKENLKNRDALAKVIDSTYFKGGWKAESAAKLGNKEIFSLGGKSYTQNDFARFMESQMTVRAATSPQDVINSSYKTWVDESVIAFEDTQLEKKYVDFANLYREYRDGILLFDLTDQKVWSKAVRDSAGLREFYEKNKNKYMWEERADVTIYKCLNDKVAKDVRKMLKAGKSEKEIQDALNKSSQLNVSVENITYLKGENKYVDQNWKQGVAASDNVDDKEKKVQVLVVNKINPRTPKTIAESRGAVTADYQTHLENEWLKYLRDKYKVKVNEDVLSTVK
jgi:peptidyl-prolyl cis-trans isomerase SurA